MTVEAIEFASLRAEERACAFLRANPSTGAVRGNACVAARFGGAGTLASFLRIDAILTTARHDLWLIRRRWASAGGDARLDEAMCLVVAAHLQRTFGTNIEAFVVVRIS